MWDCIKGFLIIVGVCILGFAFFVPIMIVIGIDIMLEKHNKQTIFERIFHF